MVWKCLKGICIKYIVSIAPGHSVCEMLTWMEVNREFLFDKVLYIHCTGEQGAGSEVYKAFHVHNVSI